jgi:ferric-dicitrate binding protein FerR (iron transport regulator)
MEMISPVAWQTIKAGAHEIKKLRLPDQSLVTLDTGSTIRFPVEYRGSERPVDLIGKAFFEVTKNAKKTFVVHTSSLDVTVHGTSFVVSDQNLIFSTVSVVTGKVGVTADKKQLAELRPGLQLSYNRQTAGASLQTVDPRLMIAWTRRSLSFTEAPLEQVLAAIAQKWNLQLILPPSSSGKQFSGDFSDADSLEDMLKAVALATKIHWERTPGAIRIQYHP